MLFGWHVNLAAFATAWQRHWSLAKATIGYIVPEYFKWPGFLSPSMGLKFSDVPNGLAAIGKVPGNGWAQIVAFAGYYELFVYKYSGVPGEYGWKAISSPDPEVRKRKLSAELANGRLVSRLRIMCLAMWCESAFLIAFPFGVWAMHPVFDVLTKCMYWSSLISVIDTIVWWFSELSSCPSMHVDFHEWSEHIMWKQKNIIEISRV